MSFSSGQHKRSTGGNQRSRRERGNPQPQCGRTNRDDCPSGKPGAAVGRSHRGQESGGRERPVVANRADSLPSVRPVKSVKQQEPCSVCLRRAANADRQIVPCFLPRQIPDSFLQNENARRKRRLRTFAAWIHRAAAQIHPMKRRLKAPGECSDHTAIPDTVRGTCRVPTAAGSAAALRGPDQSTAAR